MKLETYEILESFEVFKQKSQLLNLVIYEVSDYHSFWVSYDGIGCIGIYPLTQIISLLLGYSSNGRAAELEKNFMPHIDLLKECFPTFEIEFPYEA